MSNINIDDIRGKLQQVLDQAKGDANFLTEFKANPQATLENGGLEAAAAKHIVDQELNFSGDDVSGYMRCTMTCDRWSCIATWCANVPYTGS